MVLRLGLAGVAVALTACGTAAATRPKAARAPAAHRSCGPKRAQTVARDPQARVYTQSGAVYGCSTRSGRRTKLGQSGLGAPGSASVATVKLAGPFAAYALVSHGVDTGSTEVVVRKLSTGKQVASAPAVDHNFVESFSTVTALVVKSDGGAAWIGRVHSVVGGRTNLEVHELDPSPALLDSGSAIDPTSLRLSGTHLTWTDGGATRSAQLR